MMFDLELLTKILYLLAIEVRTIVSNDPFRNSIMTYNIFPQK